MKAMASFVLTCLCPSIIFLYFFSCLLREKKDRQGEAYLKRRETGRLVENRTNKVKGGGGEKTSSISADFFFWCLSGGEGGQPPPPSLLLLSPRVAFGLNEWMALLHGTTFLFPWVFFLLVPGLSILFPFPSLPPPLWPPYPTPPLCLHKRAKPTSQGEREREVENTYATEEL